MSIYTLFDHCIHSTRRSLLMAEPVVSPSPAPVPDPEGFCLKTRYKALLPPGEAKAELRRQLQQTFGETVKHDDALTKLLVELGPVFWKGVVAGELPKYEVWLVHGHYNLKPNEKMVSRRDGEHDIMQPMDLGASEKEPPHLAVERWDYDGQALEHRILDANETFPPPPPKELWDGFRRIMDARGITALGVTVAPPNTYRQGLLDGLRFVERTGPRVRRAGREVGDRKHVTTFEATEEPGMIQIAWLPINPSEAWLGSTTRYVMAATALSVPDLIPDPNTKLDDMVSVCCTHVCEEQSCEDVKPPDPDPDP